VLISNYLAQGGGSSVLQEVAARLETGSDEDDDDASYTLIVHLYPTDCPNITTAMKTMILGFIDSFSEGSRISLDNLVNLTYSSRPK